jgi:hypothetical protein
VKTISILILLAALLAWPALAQYAPNQTFTNGTTTAQVAGPYPACPSFFNWCQALNTTQYLWFFASTSDPAVNVIEVTATYLDPSGKLVTLAENGKVIEGKTVVCLTLPYPAALQSATILPVIAQAQSTVLFTP